LGASLIGVEGDDSMGVHVRGVCSKQALLLISLIGSLGSSLLACGSDGAGELQIQVNPLVAGDTFSCSRTYAGIGTGKATARPLDFRLYVNHLTLKTASGESVPFVLKEDELWQRDGVALLDFEDDTGSCKTGSPETNAVLVGTAPARSDYVALQFAIGLPTSMNHLDAATAPAPFNAPGMWWSWQGGYKYVRIDIASESNPGGYYFHLGGTDCAGGVKDGITCKYDNIASVALSGFQMGKSQLNLDIAPLYSGVDINHTVDGMTDFVAGCMAFSGDPECPAMFSALGLAFEPGASAASATSPGAPTQQRMFTVR
jgi:uncharacterized repeat protein (TIGR04052 family)